MAEGARFNLKMAQALVEHFGGDQDYEFVVGFVKGGHSGPGSYVWAEDYPEDGMTFLGRSETTELLMQSADGMKLVHGVVTE